MLEKDTLIPVKNSSRSRVGYLIPDMGNLHRNFMPHETKEIPFEELKKLMFVPGGETMLRNRLTILNQEALSELLNNVEPEYFYTEEDVEHLLKSGTLEQFMDFLDFAPTGLIELAKNLAVSMEVNDVAKREAIFKKTGFDVTKAIQINRETSEDDNDEDEKKVRRSNPIKSITKTDTGRRTEVPKYKVTSKAD